MCFAELALTALGSGISAYGARQTAKDEAERTAEAVAARNAELDRVSGLLNTLGQENTATFNNALGSYVSDPTAAQTARAGYINAGAAPLNEAPITLSENAPQVANAEYAKQARETFADSKSKADAAGALGGFGDMLFDNSLSIGDAASNINMNNNFARAHLGMLPQMQDLAQLSVARSGDSTGQTLQALGKMMGQAAGSGFGQNIFGTTKASSSLSGPSYLTGVY